MGIRLYDHNAAAYHSALTMLQETGKAAVIHPTGTGKSFIAFKFCEDFPDKRICWLSPSEYIFRAQLENLTAAGGEEPENVTFLTYARLMILNEMEISALKPDLIVLDEFHRCGAEQWGRGVEALLRTYPEVPLLGLSATNVRYLDNWRDMAAELFDGNVASEITLGEAIARGILRSPKYVLAVYSYQKDLERYKARVHRAGQAVRERAEELLETLRRCLADADGLEDIFQRHMPDKNGKYIVFCANAAHMDDMIHRVPEWFSLIDPEPHIYRAYSPDPATRQAFDAFRKDESGHLKLLFTIDMLNEGIHVADVDGVILFRPTVSPIVYKQQIGRALSAGSNKRTVIFDIVNNIENLSSIGAIKREFEDALLQFRPEGGEGLRERFQVLDEVRDCRQLFEELNDVLTASWEEMYSCAQAYYEEHNDLNVPDRYRTKDGRRLGSWLATQRAVRKGLRRGILSEERAARLESIGMVWQIRSDGWTRYYEAAKGYAQVHGDLWVPQAYTAPEGVELGIWLVNMRAARKRGRLTRAQIAALDKLGMVWDVKEAQWERQLQAARAYRQEHGNLDIPAGYVDKAGVRLGNWLARARKAYTKGKLSLERTESLEALGVSWRMTARQWERMYQCAAAYYQEHGDLLVEQSYVDRTGLRLGNWIQNNRQFFKVGTLSGERVRALESIGMVWDRRQAAWEQNCRAAEEYRREHGDLEVPMSYITPRGLYLGRWIGRVRREYKTGKLSQAQIGRLEAIGMVWSVGRGRSARAARTLQRTQESGTGYGTTVSVP